MRYGPTLISSAYPSTPGLSSANAPPSSRISTSRATRVPSRFTPVFTRTFIGWRARTVSKSSSRVRISFTVRFAFSASNTATGCTCGSILLPNPAPTRGVRQRSFAMDRPVDSDTLACTRNTD